MNSEKEHLIQNKEIQDGDTKKLVWNYFVLSTSMFVFFTGCFTLVYGMNEWVQQKVRTDLFPNLVSSKQNMSACGDTNKSDPVYKNYTIVQQHAAHWSMYFTIAYHVPMFFVNMILNTYTDTYGRKFILIISVTGSCIKACVITAVICTNSSLWYIIVAHVIDGSMGSFYATIAGCFAYAADLTTNNSKHRVLGIVVIDSLYLVSSIVSGTLSGFLIQTLNLGYAKTAVMCASTAFLGLLILIFVLPESLPKSKRSPAKPLLGTVKQMLQFYTSSKFKGKRLGYIILISAFCTAIVSSGNRNSIEQLYLLGLPFCWGPAQIGVFLTARHASQGVLGVIVLKLLQLCISDEAIVILGPISSTASYVIEGLATTDIMIYMVPVSGVLSFIMIPLTRAIMSSITDPDKQGAMFSSMAAIEVLSSTTGLLVASEIYAKTYAFMHGFVFLVLAGVSVINCLLLIAYYVFKTVKGDQKAVNLIVQ